jgi:hypothetical protein
MFDLLCGLTNPHELRSGDSRVCFSVLRKQRFSFSSATHSYLNYFAWPVHMFSAGYLAGTLNIIKENSQSAA